MSSAEDLNAAIVAKREQIEAARQAIHAARRTDVDADQFSILLNRLETTSQTMGQLIVQWDLEREKAS